MGDKEGGLRLEARKEYAISLLLPAVHNETNLIWPLKLRGTLVFCTYFIPIYISGDHVGINWTVYKQGIFKLGPLHDRNRGVRIDPG